MSRLLSALFATVLLGTTYGVYAGDGACNHAKKDVNAATSSDRMQLASGYPESGANTTGTGDMMDNTGNTGSGATDAVTGNRSGSGASGGTGSDPGNSSDTGSTGADAVDNSTTDSDTSGSGTGTDDM